jgi:hypothetical protein
VPFYKIGKYGPNKLSHRHPFYGAFGMMAPSAAPIAPTAHAPEGTHYEQEGLDPFDFDYRMIDRRFYDTVQGFGGVGEAWGKAKEPLLRGLIAGVLTWGVAKAVGIAAPQARKLGVVIGVMDAGVTFATETLIKGATATKPAVAVEAPAAVPVPVPMPVPVPKV